MAYTTGTTKTRIQQRLDNTSFDATKLLQFINDGQRDIMNARRWTFMEAESSVTTTSGSDSLTSVPSTMQVPLMLKLTSPTNLASIIPYIEYEDMDINMPVVSLTANGPPIGWYIFGGTVKIYPQADATYTLKLKYLKTPTELTSDSDVPQVPEEFSEALVLAALKRALEHDDEYDKAQLIQQELDIILDAMATRYRRQLGIPHVMRSSNRKRIIGRW